MNELTIVSFPALGVELELKKVAFSLFGLDVRWYGIIITLGIVIAFFYTIWRGKRNEGIKSDDIIDIGIVTVIAGIVGARAYYVLTTLDEGHYESFIDVIAIWNGGIAIYGAIIGGAIGLITMCIIKKIAWRKMCDMAVPGVMIAQSLGRWGNFFNGEAHGSLIAETTELDLFGKILTLPSGEGTFFHFIRMGLLEWGDWVYYHPTFLYESVWNLCGFVLLNIFYKRKKFDGQITLMYFAWYGLGRMFIEGFRTDSLYIPGTALRISQCVGLLCVLAGGVLLTVFLIRNRHNDPFEGVVLEETVTPAWVQKGKDFLAKTFQKHPATEPKDQTKDQTEDQPTVGAEGEGETNSEAEESATSEEETNDGNEN